TCGKAVAQTQAVWYVDGGQCSTCYRQAKAQPKPKPVADNLILAHRDWSQSVRDFVEKRNADGQPLWDWGMRNTLDGAAIIRAAMDDSMSVAREVSQAVRDACTMHFDPDVRQTLKVSEFDFVGFGVPRYLEIVSRARVPLPRDKQRSV